MTLKIPPSPELDALGQIRVAADLARRGADRSAVRAAVDQLGAIVRDADQGFLLDAVYCLGDAIVSVADDRPEAVAYMQMWALVVKINVSAHCASLCPD